MNKNLAFEFLLYKLLLSYKERKKANDLSLLKAIKLLFFISTSQTEQGDPLNIFDNYVAMPYGHVEIDIYNAIKSDDLRFFSLNNKMTLFKQETINRNDFSGLNNNTQILLESSLNRLLSINPNIINFGAFDLVNLSHEWYSWDYYFNTVKSKYSSIISIPTDVIREEEKKYFL